MKPRTLLLAVLSMLPLAAPAATDDADLKATLQRRLSGDRSGACIAAAVIDGGVRRAFVCADGRTPRVDARTAFEIGSIAKTMNAALLAQFVLAGRVSLDTPLAELLPPATTVPQFDGQPIRLGHVVTHRSGLPALPPGREVSAIVRPERVVLEPAGAANGGDGLVATVTDVIYLGQSLRYHLESRQHKEVVAISTDRGARFAPGAPVRLTWRPDDVWVIPD